MHLVAAWIQDTSAMSLNPQNHGSCQAVCPTAWKQGWILNAPNMPLSSTFLLLLEKNRAIATLIAFVRADTAVVDPGF